MKIVIEIASLLKKDCAVQVISAGRLTIQTFLITFAEVAIRTAMCTAQKEQ
jgi:hypothetical protein